MKQASSSIRVALCALFAVALFAPAAQAARMSQVTAEAYLNAGMADLTVPGGGTPSYNGDTGQSATGAAAAFDDLLQGAGATFNTPSLRVMKQTVSATDPFWVTYTFDEDIVITAYSVQFLPESEWDKVNRAPRTFTLMGSPKPAAESTDADWVELEAPETETGWTHTERRYFSCNSSGIAYRSYKWVCTANNGGNYTAITELELFQIPDSAFTVAGVPEEKGSPDPDYGPHTRVDYEVGSTITCTGPEVSYSEDGSTRYTCIGWDLYQQSEGEASETLLASGTGGEASFTYQPDLKLVWKLQRAYKVSVKTFGAGTVSIQTESSDGYFDEGVSLDLTATADEGMKLYVWRATAGTFSNERAAQTSLTVTGPADVTAFFLPDEMDSLVQYVDPNPDLGNDDNNGYRAERPKRTIQAALAELAPLSEIGPCTIRLADGVYEQKSGVRLGSETTNTAIVMTNAIAVIGNLANPSAVVITNATSGALRLVSMSHADAFLAGVTLTKGRTDQTPGANVRIHGAGGTVSNCVVTAGFGTNWNGRGGNVQMNSEAAFVTHCVITKGRLGTGIGGDSAAGVQIENGTLAHSLVAENYETIGGGTASVVAGVFIRNGLIENCTIANNSGISCGGLFVGCSVNNWPQYVSSKALVRNCVIAGNTASNYNDDRSAYAVTASWAADLKAFFSTCALDAVEVPNASCLSATAAALMKSVGDGDYTLAAGSPAIDAGATLENPPVFDLAGDPRVRGNVIDLGCYESDPTALAVAFETDRTRGMLPQELPLDVAFTATVTGLAEGETVASYEWDFDGDGTFEDPVSAAETIHPYSVGGIYTVALKVTTSAGRSLTVTKHDLLQFSQRVLYVDAASANPVASYASWETAATTLADAVAAAVDGCEIVVREGTYPLSARVAVEKHLHIHSELDDPGTVILTKPASAILYVNHADAWVSGLTLSDGSSDSVGSGLTFGAMGGVVSNCVVRNSKSFDYNGSCVSFVGPGLLTHSVITNCTGAGNRGGGIKYAIYLEKGGRLENSLIVDNHGSVDGALLTVDATGSLRNNTFVNNRVANRGLCSFNEKATIVNNVFAGNEFVGADETTTDDKTFKGFNFGAADVAYTNCAFDATCGFGDAAPNDTCRLGTATGFFKDFAAGDYRPKAGGPLVNKGRDYDGLPAVDLAGKPRKSGKVDIGCHEAASFFMVIVR